MLFKLFSYFLPSNYNNLEKVKKVKVPKLFIHGDKDGIVPYNMGEKLYKSVMVPNQLYNLYVPCVQ